jgi:signal transduction histidine kinase
MFLIRRWISCPLREMTAVLQGFAMDNLSLRMPVTGQDEIAHLANGFNRMADKLDRQLTLVRSSNLTLNTIIEHNPFGILLIEEGDQLHHANQTALETLGYRSDEFSGTLFSSLVDGPSPFDGYDQPIETRFRQSNGRSIPVFCKAISIVIEAGPMRMVTFIDYRGQQQARLEMQRALEAIEGANRTKNQFLTTISHETLTPLNGIMGMAQVLEETELDDDQRIYLSALHQSAEQLLNIIKEVLDYTRLEANRSEGIATTFNPLHLVNTTVDLVRGLADARRLTIAIEHDPLLPDEVSGNPESIQKVLMQLLENALKYTNEGGIRVRVTMSSHDFDQVRLTWQVIDSGIGISLDRREELFQPFVQEDGSITRTFGGTGLGLALARQLVETMSGAIDFESEPGKGSTFWFTIPLAVDPLRHAPP